MPLMPHSARRRRLVRSLKSARLDAMLITDPVHVHYLTGFTGDSSFLLVMPRTSILFSDSRFEIQIREECPDLETDIRGPDRNTWQSSTEAINKLGIRQVGFEATHLTVASLGWLREMSPTVEWSPQFDRVEALRAIKDATEIDYIRRAIATAEAAFTSVRAIWNERDTERDVAAALEHAIRRAGGDGAAFEIIVASGPRSALPHAPPTNRLIRESPFLLIDWGARYRGYHSDMTRVLGVGLDQTATERRSWTRLESKLRGVYTTVLAAQRAAAAVAKDGVHVKDVDAAARKVIADAGYAERFNHGLGHGIGLRIHEAPAVRTNSNDTLRAGMVITLEPGVYFPDFGGVRIEDDFLITADGCERLGRLPHEWETESLG